MLSSKGEELVFNVQSMARNQQVTKECQNYVQVATEFLDWVFLTHEEQARRQQEETHNRMAVQNEIEKINRSLRQLEQGINEPTKTMVVKHDSEFNSAAQNRAQAEI